MYFYGLERRILLDDADQEAVAEEVLRLRSIYGRSRSFQRYSTSLLWLILALTGARRLLDEKLVAKIVASTDRWDDESLERCLAYVHESGANLSPDLALVAAQHDPRATSSVIVSRHTQLFRELFTKKYKQRWPDGLGLRASKRSKALTYQPASGTLSRMPAEQRSKGLLSIPDVLAISSQFKPLVEIWNECIQELRTYDKVSRGARELTAEAYEALPSALRGGDHPDVDAWMTVWQECANEEGIPLVPMSRLAALKALPERKTLLKTQTQKLLATADCLGIGVEPDARLTGRNYRWEDVVTMFFLEEGDPQDPAAYQAASTLLELGLIMAEADGRIDEGEVAHIARHLEDQFELTWNQSKRLESLRLLRLNTNRDARRIFASLRKRLSHKERLSVGEYLVGVAASDQIVTESELASLQKAFRELDLAGEQLEQLLLPLQAAQPAETADTGRTVGEVHTFHLDLDAASRIRRETEALRVTLTKAMGTGGEDDEEDDLSEEGAFLSTGCAAGATTAVMAPLTPLSTAVIDPTVPSQVDGESVPEQFRPFFDAICARDEWSEQDAKQLAREHHVMLSGAIEAINDWAQEKWGDWLIEEGNPLLIRRELLNRE